MNNEQNPYEAPGSTPQRPLPGSERLTFGEALSRGIHAAHKTLVGAVVMLVIIGPMQVVSSLSGALVMQGEAFQPPAPGEPPSPALFLMMGYGCFICSWFIVLIFATPWAGGGIYGQVADHLTGKTVGSFAQYGRQFYTRILLLFLLYFAVLIVLLIPVWVVGAALSTQHMQAGQMDPEAMRELSRHPLNIIVGVFFGLALTALSTILTLVQAGLVLNNCGTMEGISIALSFVRRRFMDTFKLYLVLIVTSIPIVLFQQAGNFIPVVTTPIMAVVGCLSAIYLAYISVLNAGLGSSVYVARRPAEESS